MSIEENLRKLSNRKGLYELTFEQCLFKMKESKYGDNYTNDILEQYKMYVELTDRINERLQRSDSYYMAINIATIGALGYFHLSPTLKDDVLIFILSIISYMAMIFCTSWSISIKSNRDLYRRKILIINSIEGLLPLSLFYTELKLDKGLKYSKPIIRAKLFSEDGLPFACLS